MNESQRFLDQCKKSVAFLARWGKQLGVLAETVEALGGQVLEATIGQVDAAKAAFCDSRDLAKSADEHCLPQFWPRPDPVVERVCRQWLQECWAAWNGALMSLCGNKACDDKVLCTWAQENAARAQRLQKLSQVTEVASELGGAGEADEQARMMTKEISLMESILDFVLTAEALLTSKKTDVETARQMSWRLQTLRAADTSAMQSKLLSTELPLFLQAQICGDASALGNAVRSAI